MEMSKSLKLVSSILLRSVATCAELACIFNTKSIADVARDSRSCLYDDSQISGHEPKECEITVAVRQITLLASSSATKRATLR